MAILSIMFDPEELLKSNISTQEGMEDYLFYKSLEKNDIDLNEYQFLELFFKGRRQGKKTLEMMKIIKKQLFSLEHGQVKNIVIAGSDPDKKREYEQSMFVNILRKLSSLFSIENVDNGVITVRRL